MASALAPCVVMLAAPAAHDALGDKHWHCQCCPPCRLHHWLPKLLVIDAGKANTCGVAPSSSVKITQTTPHMRWRTQVLHANVCA